MLRIFAIPWIWCFVASYVFSAPQVMLGNTLIVGADGASGTEFFGGIPYAVPPIGELRFKPPILATSLNVTEFDARNYGPVCMQNLRVPGSIPLSEDCLKLNIVRPTGVINGDILPVMVYIHGGGFSDGFARLYNASTLVATSASRGTPIAYVGVDYRLGPLGFPTGTEASEKGALNLGLKDILVALQWIQENIGAFGGDKTKATIFGESAGSMSIAMLYLNSNIESLARAAILESGSAGSPRLQLPAVGDALWRDFVSLIPACANSTVNDTFSCLRTATAQEISDAAEEAGGIGFPFTPVIDGSSGVVPDLPSKLLSEGKFLRIPFIAGTNLDEGTAFTPAAVNSTLALGVFLKGLTPGLANDAAAQNALIARMLRLYPDDPAQGSPFGTGDEIPIGRTAAWKRAAAINGDIVFQSGRREWINAASSAGIKTFGYLFSDPQTRSIGPGVAHASELPYIYGIQDLILTQPGPGYETLSPMMMDYWISFATSLDPNDGKGSIRPTWPQFIPSSKLILELRGGAVGSIPDSYRDGQISFINGNASVFGH